MKNLIIYTLVGLSLFLIFQLHQSKQSTRHLTEEISYYTWFLQMFGPQCIDKESVHQISDKPDMVNTMYLKKFTYSIPKSVGKI